MSSDNKDPPVHQIDPKKISCSLGAPMTYDEMMADRQKHGGGSSSVKPIDMNQLLQSMKDNMTPEMKKQVQKIQNNTDKPKQVVGRDGTLYNLQAMKERRDKKKQGN